MTLHKFLIILNSLIDFQTRRIKCQTTHYEEFERLIIFNNNNRTLLPTRHITHSSSTPIRTDSIQLRTFRYDCSEVTSYISTTPSAFRKYCLVMERKRSWPAVSLQIRRNRSLSFRSSQFWSQDQYYPKSIISRGPPKCDFFCENFF